MELECSKCGRSFIAKSQKSEFCEQCLLDELGLASSAGVPKLDFNTKYQSEVTSVERAQFLKENARNQKKQRQRAEDVRFSLEQDSPFSSGGKVRFGMGLFVFLIYFTIFLLNDSRPNATALLTLSSSVMVSLAFAFSLLAIVFIGTSSKGHRFVRYSSIFVVAVSLYYSAFVAPKKVNYIPVNDFFAEEVFTQSTEPITDTSRILTDNDLANFIALQESDAGKASYAIFVDQPDSFFRADIRDYFKRLFRAQAATAYSRQRGYLYVVEATPEAIRDISEQVSQMGEIIYKDIRRGIYEVRYDKKKASMSNYYDDDAIHTPAHPSFSFANIEELRCKIPSRVRRAAENLAAANCPNLRIDILDTLLEVLEEPWQTEQSAYDMLIKALITYSAPNNEDSAERCYTYFRSNESCGVATPTLVLNYLIKAKPQQMTPYIVYQWLQNPVLWNDFLRKLGDLAEPELIEKLQGEQNIQTLCNIILYCEQFGTKASLPYLINLESYPDKLISQSARKARVAIEERVAKSP